MNTSKKKKKTKDPKIPFWKKHPELKSIADHIGKTADNMKFNDWADLSIIIGLAYVGYDLMKDWRGALIGPIGYKLATTMGGTPPVSQIAGLMILGGMGVASIHAPEGPYPVSIKIGDYEIPIREIQLEKKPFAYPFG